MTANPWITTLHLLALFVWLSHLLMTPRILAYAVNQPDEQRKHLLVWLKRSWNVLSPFGLLVLLAGLLMLFGVAHGDSSPLITLGTYLSPRQVNGHPTWDGDPSYWYITFHVKLVSALILIFSDLWLGAQIYRLCRGEQPKRGWPLATLMGLGYALLANMLVWLLLSWLGAGQVARFAGYGAAILCLAGGIMGGRKLGLNDTRGKYMAFHGLVAALIILIVILIVARPLAYGGHTLG